MDRYKDTEVLNFNILTSTRNTEDMIRPHHFPATVDEHEVRWRTWLLTYLVVIDSVDFGFVFEVNIYLVWLYGTPNTHNTEIVLELEPSLTTP